MKFLQILLVATIALITTPLTAQQKNVDQQESGDSFLMYGKDHVFAIKNPRGWVVDAATGKKLGLHAVIYPEGSSWRDAPVTMYTSFVHKSPDSPTIEKIVADDIASYKKDSPNIIVEDSASLPLGSGNEKVIVKHFRGDKGRNVEAVAYVDESKVVVMIVLSARTEKDFLAILPIFTELVHSYRFIGDNVTIGK